MVNILYVCMAGCARSPTAVDITYELIDEKCIKDVSARFRGFLADTEELELKEEDIEWADYLFALDGLIYNGIKERNYDLSKLKLFQNMRIPDDYLREDPELKFILEKRISVILHSILGNTNL